MKIYIRNKQAIPPLFTVFKEGIDILKLGHDGAIT